MDAQDTTFESPAPAVVAAATTSAWPSVASLVLRPTLLFIAGYIVNTSLHELAHALAAYWLGLPSTLFHFYVSLDLTDQTPYVQGLVRAAGPIFSLVFGVLCWFAHRALRGRWLELPLFYLAVFGVANFLGNTLAVALVGDFSNMAAALDLSSNVRTAIASVGAFLLIGFAFDIGRELREWVPPGVGALKGTAAVVVLPAIVGTALIALIYQPMALNAVGARAGEAAFWIFAAFGTLVGSARRAHGQGLTVRRADWAFALLAVLALRVLVLGIPFMP
jgi:hypothetical protein